MQRCAASCAGDSEQGYEEFLMELAKASGIATPRREDLAKTGPPAHGQRIEPGLEAPA